MSLAKLIVDCLDFLGVLLKHCFDLLLGFLHILDVELLRLHDGLLQVLDQLLAFCEGVFVDLRLLQNKRLELGALINLVDLSLLGHGCVVVALACVGKLLLQFVDLELEDLFALLLLSLGILDQVT